jgi:hypothetical protein
MKICINKCFGGFSLSDEASQMLGFKTRYPQISRTDPRLIEVVSTLGEAANGFCARLAIVSIPDEATDWEIEAYDGFEGIIYVLDGKLRHL